MSKVTDFSAIEKFAQENPLRVDSIDVDGLGTVFVREMDGETMAQWLSIDSDMSGGDFDVLKSSHTIVLHLCNEDGELLVKPKDREKKAKELAKLQFRIITALYMKCLRVSGLASDEIEEAAGN